MCASCLYNEHIFNVLAHILMALVHIESSLARFLATFFSAFIRLGLMTVSLSIYIYVYFTVYIYMYINNRAHVSTSLTREKCAVHATHQVCTVRLSITAFAQLVSIAMNIIVDSNDAPGT